MKRTIITLSIGLLGFAVSCGIVLAQGTAQISGTVKDQSGAVLPGVEITATQTDTGIARTTVTNETGSYVLPSLPLGPYKLEAALSGFRTFVQTGLLLQVNSNPVVVLDSSALVLEGCTPTNNAIDPNETVTMSFAFKETPWSG